MNRMDIDLDLLEDANNWVVKFFELKGLDSLKCYELFKGIVELTNNFIKQGSDSSQLEFDASEICIASHNPQKDYEASKDFIKRHSKSFRQQIEKHHEDLSLFFKDNNCQYFPTIESTHSDGGHKNFYFIGLNPFDNTTESSAINDSPQSTMIEYKVKQLPKPLPWVKPLLKIKIDGWKSRVFIGIPVFGIAYSLIVFLWNLFYLSEMSLIVAIISTLFYYWFYTFIWPFYDAMFNRVGMAPKWLLNMDVYEAQLRAKKSDEKWDSGKYKRILELVIFEAECPICSNRVYVTKGKRIYKGRLIGVCDESPREHVFSFDHVTKKGELLR